MNWVIYRFIMFDLRKITRTRNDFANCSQKCLKKKRTLQNYCQGNKPEKAALFLSRASLSPKQRV